MKGPLTLILLGSIIIAFSAGMAVGFFDEVQEAIGNIVAWVGGLSLGGIIAAFGIWNAAPDPIKRAIAKTLRIFPALPNILKRQAVKDEIEGSLNAAFKAFGKEGAGFIEHEVKVTWLTPGDRAKQLFFQSDKAYLKLDFSDDHERNLVEAALIFCKDGLLPSTRQFLPRPMMRAIDLTFIDEILEKRNATQSRIYFTQEVMPREIEATPETEQYLDKLALISQHGLFIRCLMPELKDYPGHVPARLARKAHVEQVEAFIQFLETTAKNRETMTKTGLTHVGQSIRTALVLVGIPYKLQSQGTRPYIKAIAMDSDKGCRTIYLLGYNEGIHYVGRIARQAKRLGIVESYSTDTYDAVVRNQLSKQEIARLHVPDGAGTRFLEMYPNSDEWPDLEDEALET